MTTFFMKFSQKRPAFKAGVLTKITFLTKFHEKSGHFDTFRLNFMKKVVILHFLLKDQNPYPNLGEMEKSTKCISPRKPVVPQWCLCGVTVVVVFDHFWYLDS